MEGAIDKETKTVAKFDLFQLGLAIPLFTVFSFAAIYGYEEGFFHFFRIDDKLIRVEVLGNVKLLFTYTYHHKYLIWV